MCIVCEAGAGRVGRGESVGDASGGGGGGGERERESEERERLIHS